MKILISLPAFICTHFLGFSDALALTATTIFVIFTSNYSQHIQQHAIDRCNHPLSEVIHGGSRLQSCMTGGQIERYHYHPLSCDDGFQTCPVIWREVRQSVHLLNEYAIPFVAVLKQPE